MRRSRLAAIVLIGLSGPAAAQAPAPEPAAAGTPEGAEALIDQLAPYVGRTAIDKGALKVEPDPAGYRVTIDPALFLREFSGGGFTLEMAPVSAVVGPRADGDWNYFSDAPIDFKVRTTQNGGTEVVDYDFGPQISKGIYSPALASVLSGLATIDGMAMTATQDDGDVSMKLGRTAVEQSAKPAANGAADIAVRQTVEGFDEAVKIRPGPGMPAAGFDLTVKGGAMDSRLTLAAARTRPLLDLWAFLVAHPDYAEPAPDKTRLAAAQEELKSRLRDVLPIWDEASAAYRIADLAIGSPAGGVTAKAVSLDLSMDGISRAGVVTYAFGFSGLDLSSPAIPAWAPSLIPQEAQLRFKMDNLDLRTPIEVALDDLDFARAEPLSAEAQARIGEALANNPPRFVLEPSRLRSRDLDVSLAGSMVVSAGRPAVTMDISAAGIDKAISTLQEAARENPDINQAVGGLSIAKGFGKTLPDGRTQWVIDAASDGSVKVNGFEIKAADPAAVPDADVDDDDGIVPDGGMPSDQAPTDDNALPDAAPRP